MNELINGNVQTVEVSREPYDNKTCSEELSLSLSLYTTATAIKTENDEVL